MAKRGTGAAGEAARRARATARPALTWREQLQTVGEDIARHDREREALMLVRDRLVLEGRREGATWPELERLTGVSRPALLKRGAGG